MCRIVARVERGKKTPRFVHNSVRCTVDVSEKNVVRGMKALTILGPALKGVNIIGFSVNFVRRSSSHRSGSNTSTSGPHNVGFRCVNHWK